MTSVSLRQAIETALQHHVAGRLAEAESIYAQVIQACPTEPEPIHLMGVIALQRGEYDASIELINRAISINSKEPRFHCNLGQAYAGKGMPEEAVRSHRHALWLAPEMPEALNNLGNALQALGKFEEAVKSYRKAMEHRPEFVEAYNNLGNALRGCGRHAEAIESYRKAVSLHPNYADALSNIAAAYSDEGRIDEAYESIRKAVDIEPRSAEAQNNLCNILRRRGDLAGAIAAGQCAIELRDDFLNAYCTLGTALLDNGQIQAAIEIFQKAIAREPRFAEAHNNLGNALRVKGDLESAIKAYEEAIACRPSYAEAHANLAKLLHTLERYEEAISSLDRALALRPAFADALSDLGTSLCNVGRIDEGIQRYRQALQHAPDDATSRYNLGLSLLLTGDYLAGWPDCEARWKSPELEMPYPTLRTPRWDGGDLNGRHIVIFAEQGYGDAIQFSRYVPLVAQRGGTVTFSVQPELVRLMQGLGGSTRIVSIDQSVPAHDVHHALLSLPSIFQTTVDSIPTSAGYLKPDAADAEKWRTRLTEFDGQLKVGIVWAGRKNPDPKRSIPPQALEPLSSVKGVRFFSLQRTMPGTSPADPPPDVELTDLMPEVKDFADTAALIDSLDLVISIDTAVAHLAGALGKPVWILLPFLPDWRWMLKREDSPWYASAQLFRQPERKDWQTPMSRLIESLRRRAAGG